MHRPVVYFILGIAAYWFWIHYVQKVPMSAAKPGS